MYLFMRLSLCIIFTNQSSLLPGNIGLSQAYIDRFHSAF